MRPYHVLLRVRRPYFDEILAGRKQVEMRPASARWRTIAKNAGVFLQVDLPPIAILACGPRSQRRSIRAISYFVDARSALGRDPTPDEIRDLGAGEVIGFALGPVLARDGIALAAE